MNVYQRIAEVMKDVQYLAKDDSVEFKTTKYKAISEEKVTSAVRAALIKHGLVVFPAEQKRERVGTITSVDVTYRIQNIEDPEDYVFVASSGDGADTQDKGAGKAMTYAFKYMFLRTFAIPTGEDPDKISSAQLDDEAQKRPIDLKKQRNIVSLMGKVYGDDAPNHVMDVTGYAKTAEIPFFEYDFIVEKLKRQLPKGAEK